MMEHDPPRVPEIPRASNAGVQRRCRRLYMRATLWRMCSGACAWRRRLLDWGGERGALTQPENIIRAVGPGGGAGLADALRGERRVPRLGDVH